MQVLPIIVVLGAVSWMVCAVSLQGETGNSLVSHGRPSRAAHRGALAMGTADRSRTLVAVQALLRLTSAGAMAALRTATDVARGFLAATVTVRAGFREDAAAMREWWQAGRERLAPVLLWSAEVGGLAGRTLAPPTLGAIRRAGGILRRWRAAAPARQADGQSAIWPVGERAVGFAQAFATNVVEVEAAQVLGLAEEEEDERHVRGVLGLIILIALIGFLIAAGLMTVAWGVKHLIVLKRSA